MYLVVILHASLLAFFALCDILHVRGLILNVVELGCIGVYSVFLTSNVYTQWIFFWFMYGFFDKTLHT